MRKDGRVATNLRFQPYGTFELYTEQVLLCGPPSQDLHRQMRNGPIVLNVPHDKPTRPLTVYACHDLESVFSVGKQD